MLFNSMVWIFLYICLHAIMQVYCNDMSELFFYVLDTKHWVLRKFSASVIPMLFCGDQTCVQNSLTMPQASCCGESFPKLVWL